MSKYFRALSVMVGYIIGVGMFGLPFLTAKSGIVVFLVLLVILGLIQYFLHSVYANVVLETEERHRMPGYAEIYLGKKGKYFAFLAKMAGNLGALLAYIIISGIFAYQLFEPIFGGSEFTYATIIFFIEAFIVLLGLGVISEFELFMTAALLAIILLIGIKGVGNIDYSNYRMISWQYLFLPFGAMLFAFDGMGSIPLVSDIVGKDRKKMKSIVKYGTLIPIVVILLFTLVTVGITGDETTPDALTGINAVMGNGLLIASLLLGLLTITTSYIGVSEAIKETLMFDFKVDKHTSWIIAMFIPYFLYLIGLNNLTEVISFAGAIAGGIGAIILISIFRKMEKMGKNTCMFRHRPGNFILFPLIGLFIFGMIYEIWVFFFV